MLLLLETGGEPDREAYGRSKRHSTGKVDGDQCCCRHAGH